MLEYVLCAPYNRAAFRKARGELVEINCAECGTRLMISPVGRDTRATPICDACIDAMPGNHEVRLPIGIPNDPRLDMAALSYAVTTGREYAGRKMSRDQLRRENRTRRR